MPRDEVQHDDPVDKRDRIPEQATPPVGTATPLTPPRREPGHDRSPDAVPVDEPVPGRDESFEPVDRRPFDDGPPETATPETPTPEMATFDEPEPPRDVRSNGDRVDEPVFAAEPMMDSDPVPATDPLPVGAQTNVSANTDDDLALALFGEDDVQGYRDRWRELQAEFVDDPKRAVEGADELVSEVAKALTQAVTEHKQTLDDRWHDGAGETEDLRVVLRRYRSLFDQMLST